jgi:MFS family permease
VKTAKIARLTPDWLAPEHLQHLFWGLLVPGKRHSLAVAGQLLVLIGLLSVGSGILWGRVSGRFGRGQAFLLPFLLQGMGFTLLWLIPLLGAFVVASVLMGLALRAAYTVYAAAAEDYVPLEFSATAFGLMSIGAGLGSSISPVIAGAIGDTTGTLSWAFALALGTSVTGARGAFFLQHSVPTSITAQRSSIEQVREGQYYSSETKKLSSRGNSGLKQNCATLDNVTQSGAISKLALKSGRDRQCLRAGF